MSAEVEAVLDETLAPGCGGCGRSLPRPGDQCPECGAFPDLTREELAAELARPGELSNHRADVAERDALALMVQFTEATRAPDRLRKQAELEAEAAEIRDALTEAVADRELAVQALAAAEAAEAEARKPLDECLEIRQRALAKLEAAERTMAGPQAEYEARRDIVAITPVLEKYQRPYEQAQAKTATLRLEVERLDLQVAMCEQAKDEDAKARLHLGEVRTSPERLLLLARPLTEYMAELAEDQLSGNPQYPGEWANLMGLLYQLAGATGLLAMAEEGGTVRAMRDLFGPVTSAEAMATLQRRMPGDHLSLPPAPGEASMTLVPNRLS